MKMSTTNRRHSFVDQAEHSIHLVVVVIGGGHLSRRAFLSLPPVVDVLST